MHTTPLNVVALSPTCPRTASCGQVDIVVELDGAYEVEFSDDEPRRTLSSSMAATARRAFAF